MINNKKVKKLMNVLKPTIDAVSLNNCPSHCGLQDNSKICGQHEDDCVMCWQNAVRTVIANIATEDVPYDLKPAIKTMFRSGCPSDCGLEDKDEVCGISNVSCLVCWNEALNNKITEGEGK